MNTRYSKLIVYNIRMEKYQDIQHFALVDCDGYAGIDDKKFYYGIPKDIDVRIGDVFGIEFGKRQAVAIVREITDKQPKGIKNIKLLGKKLSLPSNLPGYYIDLADWLKDYYVSSSKSVWGCLLPSGIKAASKLRTAYDKSTKKTSLKPINELTKTQSKAFEIVAQSKTTLLHGITGSGKTELYLHAIANSIADSNSTILLVPEIMLTTQIEKRLHDHFDNVITIHSGIRPAMRKKIW